MILAVLMVVGISLCPARVSAETKPPPLQTYVAPLQKLWDARPVVEVIRIKTTGAAGMARTIERSFPPGTVVAVGVGPLKTIVVTGPASVMPEVRQLVFLFDNLGC
jgi:hypothetical protein